MKPLGQSLSHAYPEECNFSPSLIPRWSALALVFEVLAGNHLARRGLAQKTDAADKSVSGFQRRLLSRTRGSPADLAGFPSDGCGRRNAISQTSATPDLALPIPTTSYRCAGCRSAIGGFDWYGTAAIDATR